LTVEFEDLKITPLPPTTLPIVKGWGEVDDPYRDCRITADGAKVAIEVPGTPHGLGWGYASSPRILQEVEGDFVAQVKIASALRAEIDAGLTGQGPASQSGSLLIWKDRGHFIRLDRESREVDGKLLPLCSLEAWTEGKPAIDKERRKPIVLLHRIPDQVTHLRLERRQGKLYASFSQDGGKTWQPHPFGPLALDLPNKVKVGVAAVNMTTKPLKVAFEDLQIRPAAGTSRGPGP
jgi:hypothetical protein